MIVVGKFVFLLKILFYIEKFVFVFLFCKKIVIMIFVLIIIGLKVFDIKDVVFNFGSILFIIFV